MVSLVIHAVLGVGSTGFVVWRNRRLFSGGWRGARVSLVEAALYVAGFASLILGWWFNINYVAEFGARAS
jgi:hypothetical protein